MAFDSLESADLKEILDNYIEKIRPPEEIRKKLDYNYKIQNQSIILIEIRPLWNNPNKIIESPFAKTTFIKRKKVWKVYWMRANLKWYLYDPKPEVTTLKKFLNLVEKDEYHCFFG